MLKNFYFLFTIITIVILSVLLEPLLSYNMKSWLFSLSAIIRSVLLFLLPFLILPFMISGFAALKEKGIKFIFGIFALIAISNFIAIMVGYAGYNYFTPQLHSTSHLSIKNVMPLEDMMKLNLPTLLSMEHTLILGVLCGIITPLLNSSRLNNAINYYYKLADSFLQKVLLPLLPVYIFGTLINIKYSTDFSHNLVILGQLLLIIITIQVSYIFFLFLLACGFNLRVSLQHIKQGLPAVLSGFITMSRVITLPLTIKVAEQSNPRNPLLARVSVSSLVNNHAIGDCLALPLIILTLANLPHSIPLANYIHFALLMTLAQFTAVSIPGGSLIILMPLLKSHFGLTSEMLDLIFACDIFFDSLGTSMNLLGDLAITALICNFWSNKKKIL